MRQVVLFVASLFVATSAESRPDWLHVAIPHPGPHSVDLSGAATFHTVRAAEDADLQVLRRSSADERSGDSILPNLGMMSSNAEFDGRGKKHHHMVTYGLEGFHPFGGDISGSVGTRGGMIHFTLPNGQ